MLSHLWGVRLAVLIAAAGSLSACRTLSPDGGMDTVAMVAGTGLNKDVIQVRSVEDAAAVRTRVTRLLHRPLSADAAVQIALLNNLDLQAAYNRLGIAEALAVKASRPPALSFAISDISTPVELDIERKVIGSLLSLLTMPARTRIADNQFSQAELRAAEETLRVAAETRRAYVRAVAAREIVTALGEAKATAEASAEVARQLKQTGAVNKLDQARREVFATETDAQLVGARQQATAGREKLTRLMGLWHTDLDAYLPSALPQLPGSIRSIRTIEQDALNVRVDVQMARLEMEAMAKSYGLTRKTHFLNVLDAAGISKTQKNKGEKRADGGGYELVLEVPLFDFGKANVREAEQRYLEAANRLGQLGVNAASEAREAFGAYRASYAIARKYEGEVLPLRQTISAETELQYNAMQVDAFVLLETARERARAKVAGIEAKRNFWLASTDLSVAMLGGGLGSEPDAAIATSSSTNAE
ncbi:MAG: TolC family protein [Methyloceanibacter sp.]